MTRRYEVTVTPTNPYHGQRASTETVAAKDRNEAITRVRRAVAMERGPDDGPCTYRAKLVRE